MFDLSKPGVTVTPSPFGGGWAVPITPEGEEALAEFFCEEPIPLAPLGGTVGYIVEPYASGDLAEHLRSSGVAWRVE